MSPFSDVAVAVAPLALSISTTRLDRHTRPDYSDVAVQILSAAAGSMAHERARPGVVPPRLVVEQPVVGSNTMLA